MNEQEEASVNKHASLSSRKSRQPQLLQLGFQFTWLVISFFSLLVFAFFAAAQISFLRVEAQTPAVIGVLQQWHLTPATYASLVTARDVLVTAVFTIIGIMIYLARPQNRVVLFEM